VIYNIKLKQKEQNIKENFMEFTQEQLGTLLTSINPENVTTEIDSKTPVNTLRDLMVDLVNEKEELKSLLRNVDAKLEQTMLSLGLGETFQANDGTVFKITKPSGTFISFKEIDYLRTRKEGEKGGNFLSKKEAEELGFKL